MSSAANVITLPTANDAATHKQILADCRQLAANRLSKLIAGLLDKVEDEFFEMARDAVSREKQTLYLDARAQSRAQRQKIEVQFGLHFGTLFDRRLNNEKAKAEVYDFETMALVAEDQATGDVAVTNMAQKVRGACDVEFGMLAARVEHLLGKAELNEADNPLSPDVVAEALQNALGHLETDMLTRITILQALEGHLTKAMPGVYQDLNSHLATRQVLPNIRPGAWRPKLKPQGSTKPVAAAPVSVTTASVSPSGNGEQNLFEKLQQAFSFQGLPRSQGTASSAEGVLNQGLPTQSVIQSLTQFQREISEFQQSDNQPISESWLRELKNRPGVAGATPMDAVTIDIVALLFDHIFNDDNIPGALKVQFGRLQIPVLKVALIDKTFFSSKQHPARLLLDQIAELAIGLTDTGVVVEFLSKLVTRIQNEFESDIKIFTESLLQLETLRQSWKSQEIRASEAGALVILEAERKDAARSSATSALRSLMVESAREPILSKALSHYWHPLLFNLASAGEENSIRWMELVASAQELQWSLTPKITSKDRDRLVKMLPALIRSVVGILREAKATNEGIREFLDFLVLRHAAAVKRDESANQVSSLVPAQTEEILVNPPSLEGIGRGTSAQVDIARGTWMEFQLESGSRRGKLTWVSPKKGIYLFTNPEHIEPVSVSPQDLAIWLKEGRARVLDDKPLFERAVARALSTVH